MAGVTAEEEEENESRVQRVSRRRRKRPFRRRHIDSSGKRAYKMAAGGSIPRRVILVQGHAAQSFPLSMVSLSPWECWGEKRLAAGEEKRRAEADEREERCCGYGD